jgi:hypothetical protein
MAFKVPARLTGWRAQPRAGRALHVAGPKGDEGLPMVVRANAWLERAWRLGLASRPSLTAGPLITAAERAAGARIDDGSWLEGLDLLLGDLNGPARLSPLGRTIAHGLVSKILRQRIRAAAWWPGIPALDRPIARPVIVLGQMRSGTTRLHRLLAADPRFAFTRLSETLAPVARSRAHAFVSAAMVSAFTRRCNPMLGAIHPTSPGAAEEEFGLHGFSLHGAMFTAQWQVPGFAAWDAKRPLGSVYGEFVALLNFLRWRRGDQPECVQLLKLPQFMDDLGAVLDAFPDARLLLLERDPAAVAASSASLVWNQRRVQSAAVDPIAVGAEVTATIERREARATAALTQRPGTPVLRVDYQAMSRNGLAEMRRIYDFLSLAPPASLPAIVARAAGSSAHRAHAYDPAMFGLNAPR